MKVASLTKIGVDTNVIIRYIIQDDPVQSALATTYLEENCTEETPGFISLVVLCEITSVLRRAYRYNKTDIALVLENILNTSELAIENSQIAWTAFRQFQQNRADFADCVIDALSRSNGCSKTISFDKKACDLAGFELISVE